MGNHDLGGKARAPQETFCIHFNAAINGGKNPQPAKDDTVDEQKLDQQEQVVHRVPTEIMSVVTTPPTPVPPGSVIRSIYLLISRRRRPSRLQPQTDECSQENATM
jgi:hypothetical protein